MIMSRKINPYASRVVITVHVIYFCVYVNLAVRDALPFGIRTEMDRTELYRNTLTFVWCMCHVIQVHHYGFALATAIIVAVSEQMVNQAPAMAMPDSIRNAWALRNLQLCMAVCIGQYVQQLQHSTYVIKTALIRRQKQQLDSMFMTQQDAVIVLNEERTAPAEGPSDMEAPAQTKVGIELFNRKVKEILGFDLYTAREGGQDDAMKALINT